jgi:hypothetical protein
MKQKKKAKNYAVFCFAGFFFKKKLCYEVIVKQNFYKRSTNHYSHTHTTGASAELFGILLRDNVDARAGLRAGKAGL